MTVAVRRVERVRLVAELAAELGERRVVRARRAAGVRDAVDSIEHEAAGALEILAARLERREVDDARDPIAVLVAQRVDELRRPLAAPVRREQRIEHRRAVRVKAHPVVREHLVRQVRVARARERMHANARRSERHGETVELAGSACRDVSIRGRRDLKAVRARGLGVRGEARGPDHQHGIGRLVFGRRFARHREAQRHARGTSRQSAHQAANSPKSILPS